MKEGIKLKIGDHWCALKQDISISIEMTSPLWNDSGSFSYIFSVPYSANRHIFNAADSPESDVNLKRFKERFELYVNGVGLLFGFITCSSDEIDIENDSVDLELKSGNATFEDAIDGKSLRDLDLNLIIGYKYLNSKSYNPTYVQTYDYYEDGRGFWSKIKTGVPYYSEEVREIYNLSGIYPNKNFVNIPIIVNGKKDGGNNIKPVVLSAYRSCSSPCFFVLFILERCIESSGLHLNNSALNNIEDMRRLIILNTNFVFDERNIKRYVTSNKNSIRVVLPNGFGEDAYYTEYIVNETSDLYASSMNLPETSISDFIESLKTGFGVRLLFDDSNGVDIVLLRDVFRATDTVKLKTVDIHSIIKKHIGFPGVKVKYDNEEGDEFSYSDYSSMKAYNTYDSMLAEWQARMNEKDELGNPVLESDRILKIIKETGNFYRTKVDKEKYITPQLFEVAQFLPYSVDGDENNDDEPEELSLSFSPMIPTAVQMGATGNKDKFDILAEIVTPDEAFFVDADLEWKNSHVNNKSKLLNIDHTKDEIIGTSIQEIRFNYTALAETLKNILEYDCGFTMGIVRTTPEDSETGTHYEIIQENWDGFGNDEWVATVSTNTVTSDSVTKQGAVYDYNGSGEGIGTSLDQLISLKLWSGKQNFNPKNLVDYDENGNQITGSAVYDNNPTGPLPNRGLVPQFLWEYLHFLKYRKTLEIVVTIEVAELANIHWEKYYEVAGFRCLLNKLSFDVTNSGIGKVTMEVYCI